MSARILLVEDEPGLVMTLSDLLTAEGYEMESAPDGPIGLARATNEQFDLIILDLMLPGKNGLTVCRELRQQGNDTAILMLTAKSQLTDRVVGLKLGGDDWRASKHCCAACRDRNSLRWRASVSATW
jgi:DNA-binding response OmpR family regulator